MDETEGLLPFDEDDLERMGFGGECAEEREPLPHFPAPRNDNEELLELQYRFRHGDDGALALLYRKSSGLCMKFISREGRKNVSVRRLGGYEMQEKAHDSASYLIQRLLKDPDFAVHKSYTAYLYLRVLHELYYQSEADKIVDFVDLQTFFKDEMEAFEDEG